MFELLSKFAAAAAEFVARQRAPEVATSYAHKRTFYVGSGLRQLVLKDKNGKTILHRTDIDAGHSKNLAQTSKNELHKGKELRLPGMQYIYYRAVRVSGKNDKAQYALYKDTVFEFDKKYQRLPEVRQISNKTERVKLQGEAVLLSLSQAINTLKMIDTNFDSFHLSPKEINVEKFAQLKLEPNEFKTHWEAFDWLAREFEVKKFLKKPVRPSWWPKLAGARSAPSYQPKPAE